MENALLAAALLACPLGMGAMMWWMARSQKQQRPAPAPNVDDVNDLRAEQARLRAEIDQLEAARRDDATAERSS